MSNYYKNFLKTIIFISFLCLYLTELKANIHPKELIANKEITQLYQALNSLSNSKNIAVRINFISAFFLGKPYLLGALGEGLEGRYDQFPKHRTDAFDCETYVTTVLALALAEDNKEFIKRFRQIRYQYNRSAFIERNHFTELDWNQNNAKKGFIKDITASFKDKKGGFVAKMAVALINKPGWYQKLPLEALRLPGKAQKIKLQRWKELKNKGLYLPKTYSRILYLPFSSLFSADGRPNHFIFSQIPNVSIIEIVRPNWALDLLIGSNLNVSHMGFAVWKKGVLQFREASSIYNKVIDVPLIDYLQDARKNPTIQGINIHVVPPRI